MHGIKPIKGKVCLSNKGWDKAIKDFQNME